MTNAVARYRTVPRYRDESDRAYLERCHRWVVLWFAREPRPDQWYASDDEVTAYRRWRDVQLT